MNFSEIVVRFDSSTSSLLFLIGEWGPGRGARAGVGVPGLVGYVGLCHICSNLKGLKNNLCYFM